ncbi:uncharacterized protein LOC141679956 [Apium graveolens]|uniref:uncharacterized protein LOC141679956 n=1 Tax=Apium graveolens TaxID=4045 RepID=UPI003D7ACD1A
MARLQQTQRKRVGSVPRLPADIVAAIAAEAPEMEDPEMYEREHDEALLDVEDQEEPEMEEDEEDPSEESETEVIVIPDEEDPDEVPVAEERVGSMVVYDGIPLPTLPVVRAPTPPPPSWIPDDDSSETHTSEPRQTEEAPSAAPDSPPLDPAQRQSSLAHGYVQDVLRTRVAVAEARLDEARRELDAERAASMLRANDEINSLPPTVGDDFDYPSGASGGSIRDDSLGEDAEEVGRNIEGDAKTPAWMFTKDCNYHHFKSTLFNLIYQTQAAIQATNNSRT